MEGGTGVQVGVSDGRSVDPHIRALVVNVTAVARPRKAIRPPGVATGSPPLASTLNYTAGIVAVPNMAVVPVSPCCGGFPSIGVYTWADRHIIVDIMGFFDDSSLGDGLRFTRGHRFVSSTPGWAGCAGRARPALTAHHHRAGRGSARRYGGVGHERHRGGADELDLPQRVAKRHQRDRPAICQHPEPGARSSRTECRLHAGRADQGLQHLQQRGITHVVVDVVGTFWSPDLNRQPQDSRRHCPENGCCRWSGEQPKAVRTG